MAYQVYYIPNGPKNLETVFPDVDFGQVEKYYIEILDGGDNVIGTTTINEMDGECCEDKERIHFLNALGGIDAINFKKVTDEHETKSDNWQRPIIYPEPSGDKWNHGNNRFNVKGNNTATISVKDYPEEDMPWVNELIHTPLAWREWTGTQGQDDDYIPVKVVDGKVFDTKETDRFNNEVVLQVENSHESFIQRN